MRTAKIWYICPFASSCTMCSLLRSFDACVSRIIVQPRERERLPHSVLIHKIPMTVYIHYHCLWPAGLRIYIAHWQPWNAVQVPSDMATTKPYTLAIEGALATPIMMACRLNIYCATPIRVNSRVCAMRVLFLCLFLKSCLLDERVLITIKCSCLRPGGGRIYTSGHTNDECRSRSILPWTATIRRRVDARNYDDYYDGRSCKCY